MSGYDEKCDELARYFLPSGTSEKRVALLAQQIQDTVEDWIKYQMDDVGAAAGPSEEKVKEL